MFKSCWIHGCPLTPDLPTALDTTLFPRQVWSQCIWCIAIAARGSIEMPGAGNGETPFWESVPNQWLEPPPWGWGMGMGD